MAAGCDSFGGGEWIVGCNEQQEMMVLACAVHKPIFEMDMAKSYF